MVEDTARDFAARLRKVLSPEHLWLDDVVDMAISLVDASTSTGRLVPTVPAGQREGLVALLTRCAVNDTILTAYRAAVQALLTARRLPWREIICDQAMPDVAERLIHERGFGALTDAELARVAISPDGLDGLVESLVCGQTGPDGEPLPTGAWYWDAAFPRQAKP